MRIEDEQPVLLTFASAEEWVEEIKDWPDSVKRVALKYPATQCYRSSLDPSFHYTIHDYARDRRTDDVHVLLIHGSGSSRAGIKVYDDPSQLVPCGCGKWAFPTVREKRAMHTFINAHRAKNGLPPVPWVDPPDGGN